MQRRTMIRVVGTGLLGGIVASCNAATGSQATRNATVQTATTPLTNTAPLTLAVASSFEKVLPALAARYAATSSVPAPTWQSGSSSALAKQIIEGAVFDIFLAADIVAMTPLIDAKLIEAQNIQPLVVTDVILVARANRGISTLKDVAKRGTKIVIGDPKVAIGRYTVELLQTIAKSDGDQTFVDSFNANVVSFEEKATAVTQKFFAGDADVAVLYASDLYGHDASEYVIVQLPDGVSIQSTYYSVVLANATAGAVDFVNFLSDPAQATVWSEYGFRTLGK